MEQAIGENQFCAECRRSFHSSSDSCPICGSMRTSNLIDMGEIKTVKISASEYFLKYAFIPIRNEDGACEFIFEGDSCTFPKEEKN